jgi:ubiquitin-activating enzyme E1 C
MSTVIPFIDGGTEGFKGQARVILPFVSGCFECTLSLLPKQEVYPMCTIADTPRLPEHCIQYAYVVEWQKHFPDKKVDKDSPDDMQWIFKKALERSNTYGIAGVDYTKTIGVVKNIIPAIASSNALISAVCVNEAMKIINKSHGSLDNYYMYMGQTGIHTHTYKSESNDSCVVCQV